MKAIILVDHGSRRSKANQMLDQVVALVRRQVPSMVVLGAHMELAEPNVESAVAAAVERGADELVVVPYMLAPGRHALDDIPRLVKEAAARFPGLVTTVTGPLGVHPAMVEVVLARVLEADGGHEAAAGGPRSE